MTHGTSCCDCEYFGDSTQLLYLRARHYAPDMGRFLTRDTWDGDMNNPLSLNKWGYVSGNPINKTDPSGLCEDIGDEACWALYNEIIRWRPDLANANIPISQYGSIPLRKASYQQLKFILDNRLWSICLITPKTEAINYTWRNSCDAVKWVTQHQNQIIASAKSHGLPPELVAGVLASELDFDYEWKDWVGDRALQAGGEDFIARYLQRNSNPGPGVASIHLKTWKIVQQYYLDCGYELGTTLAPGGQTLSDVKWIMAVLTPTGAIEGASAVARFLADYRTGSGGQPKKTAHYNDLNFVDMAQIFGAYRAGVGGLTCFNDPDHDGLHDCGFENINRFQIRTDLEDEARQSYPYFVFFERYFEYYRQKDDQKP